MSTQDVKFSSEFERETWALYAVGIFAVGARFVARIKRLGIGGLQLDDYLMITAVLWYTLLCVALNQVVSGGGSNLMTEEDIRNLTPITKAARVAGSKWVYLSEHVMVLTIWTMKFCMLTIYARITNGLSQRHLVNYCAIYVGLTFVATELSLFLICRPITNYWAVPTPDYQCSSYQYYEIVNGCLSITGDIFMLLVAIPLLMTVRLPLKQKVILILLFGLGIFVIIAALLTKIYCLVPSLISYVYMNWYFREATVAMLVTNLPLTWSLMRDIFPMLKSWTGGSRPTGVLGGIISSRRASRPALQSSDYKLRPFSRLASNDPRKSVISSNRTQNTTRVSDDGESVRSLHIRQDVTITVASQNVKDSDDIERGHRRAHFANSPSPPPLPTPAPGEPQGVDDSWSPPRTMSRGGPGRTSPPN
ncbi:hypothetical protein FQN55_000681 [Onygenales sp. PD_40]|nr:hypothetical protein FQN55_000681 [Onygenales sp. PD_40]KAK2775256.1 hypothetical protein FQN52_004039 [Onygenales sp. PD_12]KAK2776433.1 hypothetical protein FQN53_002695 [Emmonsiellopsis sp. PD_33]KAK2801809.1 hypothetical protein FQN51_005176 [Onygenales sp. PD_10]